MTDPTTPATHQLNSLRGMILTLPIASRERALASLNPKEQQE